MKCSSKVIQGSVAYKYSQVRVNFIYIAFHFVCYYIMDSLVYIVINAKMTLFGLYRQIEVW
jgi:hypothetical protein